MYQYFTVTNILPCAVFLLVCIYFRNYFRIVILALQLRGPKAYPFIGNCNLINQHKELEDIAINVNRYFGSIARIWISFLPVLLVYEPKHLKMILGNNKCSKKNFFYTLLHNFVGEGLITNNDYKWKKNSKLIQPYFNNTVLESLIDIFAHHSRQTLSILDALPKNADIKISNITNECIVNSLHQTVLGLNFNDKATINKSPFRKGHTPFSHRVTKPWLLLENIFQFTASAEMELMQKRNLQNYARSILNKKREEIKNEVKGENCLLNMLIEIADNNAEFTEDDIINEACTFMLAGQDSVGSATAFTLYFLAKYQDVQERVYEELRTVFRTQNENITMEHLQNMKYLEQCVKETLRLAPSIPLIARVLTEDVKLDDYVLPKGTNLLISPFTTHRLAHIFPDPLKFDPERFSAENAQNVHPYGFLPFSLGARNCLGYKYAYLEIKTVIATILQKYRVILSSAKDGLDFSYKVTLRKQGGVCVRLIAREKYN